MPLAELAPDDRTAAPAPSPEPEREHSFASRSLAVHLRRGLIGFASLGTAWLLWPRVGLPALAPAAIGIVALRGCPTCWTIGLVQTLSRRRFERRCDDGVCRLVDTRRQDQTGIGTVPP